MIEVYDYFLTVRWYFVLESFIVTVLLIAAMLRFGRLIQGDSKETGWASPRPASRLYGAAVGSLWLSGILLVLQPERVLVIVGICCVIAGLQLALHVDLVMMAVWYFSKTGRTMLGLGALAAKGKHRIYLEKAKSRGRLHLEKAKNHGAIWRENVIRM